MLQLAADRSPLALCALCAAFFITGRWTAAVSPSLSRVDEPATGSPPAASLWPVYAASLDRAKYVDLTHPIEPGMPLWPAFGAPSVGPALAARNVSGFIDAGQPFTYADHGFIASALGLPTDQLGTQLDPPAHWHERGATISDVPPTVTLRPLAVIDLSDRPPDHHATRADVLAWEARSPRGSPPHSRTDRHVAQFSPRRHGRRRTASSRAAPSSSSAPTGRARGAVTSKRAPRRRPSPASASTRSSYFTR